MVPPPPTAGPLHQLYGFKQPLFVNVVVVLSLSLLRLLLWQFLLLLILLFVAFDVAVVAVCLVRVGSSSRKAYERNSSRPKRSVYAKLRTPQVRLGGLRETCKSHYKTKQIQQILSYN